MRNLGYRPMVFVLALSSFGCSNPNSSGADSAAEVEAAHELDAAVARACSLGACSDRLARVTAWRDDSGKLRLLVHEGSLELCSHPPTTYVSADGERLLDQANHPVTDDAEGERFEAERAKLLEGLSADRRTHQCP